MVNDSEYPDLNSVYPAPTAPPPNPQSDEYPTLEQVYGNSNSVVSVPSSPPQSTMEKIGQAAKDIFEVPAKNIADLATNPVTMAHALPVLAGAAGSYLGPGGATIGNVGGNLIADAALKTMGQPIPSVGSQIAQGTGAAISDLAGAALPLFKTPESLKSAGINATTLEHMAPGGQPPGDWAKAVENQFQGEGVIAKTANDTWKLMSKKANEVGQNISSLMGRIGQASPEALQVDAQTALQPITQKIQQLGSNMYSEAQTVAQPFQQAQSFLSKMAQQQGGKLTLDNIDTALQQTGEMMNGGQEAIERYGPVYGKLADVRDTIVQNVANQVGDPGIASELLKNNAQYSTYMRVLPSIEKSAYREAIKEGISAYQKHIGPLGEKMAIAGGAYALTRKAIDMASGAGQ